MTSSCPEN
ncbi:hypothetical protein ECEC4402_3129, partial [Escherichia coli EC4402]